MLAERSTVQIPPYLLVLAAPIIGIMAARSLMLGAVAAIGILALLFALTVADAALIRRAALGACALVIVYPAFVPPPDYSRPSVAAGGTVSGRGGFILAVVLIIALSAAWLWISTRQSVLAFLQPPMNLFAWYAAMIVFSLTYTPSLTWGAAAALKLFEVLLLLAVLVVLIRTGDQLRRAMDVMLAAVAFILLIYWFDKLTGRFPVGGDPRFTSPWLHPTQAAIVAFWFTSIVAARFFTARTRNQMMIAGGLTGFGALTGLMTGGKGGAGAGIIALLLTAVLALFRLRRASTLDRLAMAGLGLGLLGVYMVATGSGLAGILREYESNPNLQASNLTGRVPLWQVTFARAMGTPILGHGYMSGFTLGLPNYQGWVTAQAHNSFLQTFFDLGLAGLIPVLAIYLGTWRRVLGQVISGDPRSERWERGLELIAAMTVLTIVSFVEDVFGGVFEIRTMLFVWIVFAVYQNDRVARSAASGQAEVTQGAAPDTPWMGTAVVRPR